MSSYVQFGCGRSAPEGWLNFDSSPWLRFERLPGVSAMTSLADSRLFPASVRYGDIVIGLPVPDGSADGVYSRHVLEHLARNDVKAALANTFRILKPGGVFRLVVPDLEWRARRYLSGIGQTEAADSFINNLNTCRTDRARGLVALARAAFGNSGHRWMYDWSGMQRLLAEAGFVAIRRCSLHDSGDPMFDRVEEKYQFYHDPEGPELAIEAKKPSKPVNVAWPCIAACAQ